MSLWQALWLGILQGATEFLPVSSSGHLVIVPYLLGWADPGLTMDTILHLGTAVAVVVYFWRDLWRLARAAWESLRQRSLADPDARVAWGLVVGTVPAAIIGFLLEDLFERLFGMPRTAAAFLLGTAALLLFAEWQGRRVRAEQARDAPGGDAADEDAPGRDLSALTWGHALLIGLAQTLAIAPGLSRSGSTIAAGLLLGYRREAAARYSFLLSVPIILGSGAYQLLKLAVGEAGAVTWLPVAVGFVAAMVTGYLCIAGLLALVRRRGLWPFAAYCALLGSLVLLRVLG